MKIKYSNLLIISYILLFLPQLLCSTVLNFSYLKLLYAGCFATNIIILCFFALKNNFIATKTKIFMLCLYIFILLFTVLANYILNIYTSSNDYIDIIIKIFNFLFLYVFLPRENFDKKEFVPFFKTIMYIGLFSCLYNIIINRTVIFNFLSITNSYSVNISSFFANRNTFAMFLFISIFSTLYLIQNSSKKKEKIILFFIILMLIINLMLTMSRGALITTIILFTSYILMTSKNKKRVFLLMFFCILGIAIFLYFNPNILNFIINNFLRLSVGTTGRSSLWVDGIQIWKKNIFNGIGYYTSLELSGCTQYHSFFIDTLVESGIFGLVFKLFLIFVTIINIVRKKNAYENDKFEKMYISSYIAILFLAFFESINFFALGFTEMEFSLIFITIPNLIYRREV